MKFTTAFFLNLIGLFVAEGMGGRAAELDQPLASISYQVFGYTLMLVAAVIGVQCFLRVFKKEEP